jgi:hypothetical protein
MLARQILQSVPLAVFAFVDTFFQLGGELLLGLLELCLFLGVALLLR